MKKINSIFISLSTIFCSAFLSGCSSTSEQPEPEAAEVKPKEQVTVDLPQQELLENSKRSYYSGLYTVSLESLQALRDGYSPGPYTEFSQIKIGDAQFEMRDYLLSAATFEEFIKNHPSSRSLSYALLMAGRSFHMANKGVGRDAGPLEKARTYYERVIKEFPDSVYAGAARTYLKDIVERLAAYEEMVSAFYMKQENQDAALARNDHYAAHMKPLIEKTRVDVENQNSQIMKVDLQSDFQPELIGVNRVSEVSVRRAVNSESESLINQPIEDARPLGDSKGDNLYRIHSVKCDSRGGSKVFIFLNREFEDQSALEKFNMIEPREDVIKLNIPDTSSNEMQIDCFASQDLSINKDGAIELKTDRSATVMSLTNPARLLISLN